MHIKRVELHLKTSQGVTMWFTGFVSVIHGLYCSFAEGKKESEELGCKLLGWDKKKRKK